MHKPQISHSHICLLAAAVCLAAGAAYGGDTISFSAASFTVNESAATATITVTRTDTAAGATIDFATSDNTATAAADYTAASGTLTFAAGQASLTFDVPILNDTASEGIERINLTLSNPGGGAALGAQPTAVLLIIDDEISPNVFAVTTTNNLLNFNSATPGTIASTTPITGLRASETIFAIDFRPATGELLAVGATLTSDYLLYTLNTSTGAATVVGQFATALSGTDFGIDVNPAVDRLRIVLNATQNFRVNPNSGGTVDGDPNIAGTQADTPVAYVTGDPGFSQTPNVVATAYNNNFSGATSTTLFGIDSARDTVVIQGSPGGAPNSPNGGQLTTLGALGVDATVEIGFDITSGQFGYAAIASPSATSSILYSIDLTTGAASPLGAIGGPDLIRGIAMAPAGVLKFSAANFNVDEAAGTATITIERQGGSDGTVSVDFATSNGTATADADYTAASGTLTYAPGEISKTFTVPILNDAILDVDEIVNLTLSNPAGGAVLVVQTATLTIQNIPSISNFLVATATFNTPFSHTLTATGSQPITFAATLPSGLVLNGDSITGVVATAGVYPVQVTSSNSAGSFTQTLSIIITGDGTSKTLIDVDGDGFPDEIENAVNTSPLNTAATPFGGVPAGVVQTPVVSKLQIKLSFSKANSDGIAVSGTLPVPAGFSVAGKQVVVDVGGVVKIFILDAKGSSPKANDTFKMKIKAKKGVVSTQISKFQAKFGKGNFAAALIDEALTNIDTPSFPRPVPVVILFNQTYFSKLQPQLYTAKANKSGKTKQPKLPK